MPPRLSNSIEKKESKEREEKGINTTQLTLLKSFIGAGLTEEEEKEQGILIQSIKESKIINLGTKVLYLKRAITEECNDFLVSLDKLYQPSPDNKEKNQEMLELIRSLKKINDLCLNNEESSEYGNNPCLIHLFGRLRSAGTTLGDESKAIQEYVKKFIHQNIKLINKGHRKKVVGKQISTRKELEKSLPGNLAWRTLLELPLAQRGNPMSSTSSKPSSPVSVLLLTALNYARGGHTAQAGDILNSLPENTSFLMQLGRQSSSASSSHKMILDQMLNMGYQPAEENKRLGSSFMGHSSTGAYTRRSTSARGRSIDSMLNSISSLQPQSSPPLNMYQISAYIELHSHGLTHAHLINTTSWFNSNNHVTALVHLMTGRGSNNMAAPDALTVLEHLTLEQLLDIQSWQPSVTPSRSGMQG